MTTATNMTTEMKKETAKSGLIIFHTSPTPIADEYQEILIECFMEAEDGPSEAMDALNNRLKQMENEYNIMFECARKAEERRRRCSPPVWDEEEEEGPRDCVDCDNLATINEFCEECYNKYQVLEELIKVYGRA